jgi:uncharacterized protein YjbI with pentapeptide repeats
MGTPTFTLFLAWFAVFLLFAVIALFFVAGLRLYWLARRIPNNLRDLQQNASRRRALEAIFKQAAAFAAVLAILYGFLQFSEDERQKYLLEEQKEFANSLGTISSNDPKASLGGIALVGELGESDANRHWETILALTSYVQSAAPRPSNEIRPDGSCHDGAYIDPTGASNSSKQAIEYEKIIKVEPAGPSLIPAQLALNILGTRETQYENKDSMNDIPTARIYLQGESTQQPINCTKNEIWQGLKKWTAGQGPNVEVVTEIPDMCPSGFSPRPWLELSKSKLLRANFRYLLFGGADLNDSDFSFSSFAFGHFAKAEFKRSSLVGTDMWATDFREADFRWADMRGSLLGKASMRAAAMSGGNFSRANFFETDLRDALLVDVDLTQVETVSGANMHGITAFRADFSGAHVAGDGQETVCMDESYLRQANFEGTELRGVDLRHADLENADFRGADLRGAKLDHSDLTSSDLRDASLDEASFRGAILVDTHLEGVNLTHVLDLNHQQIMTAKINSATVFPSPKSSTNSQTTFPDLPCKPAPRPRAAQEALFSHGERSPAKEAPKPRLDCQT